MCGSGRRSPEAKIELRRAHRGSSNYAIYYMPAPQCSPPTARPGSSMHERGLAIDFSCNGGGAIRYGNSCWNWLAAHANDYGLYNLPSEPWHWSTSAAGSHVTAGLVRGRRRGEWRKKSSTSRSYW